MEDMCTYHIPLRGQVDDGDVNAMSPLRLALERVDAEATLFAIRTDQSGLIGLMRHLHMLGLVVLSLEREA